MLVSHYVWKALLVVSSVVAVPTWAGTFSGVDKPASSDERRQAFFQAVRQEKVLRVQEFLHEDRSLVHSYDTHGVQALHHALLHVKERSRNTRVFDFPATSHDIVNDLNLDIIKLLVQYGASLYAPIQRVPKFSDQFFSFMAGRSALEIARHIVTEEGSIEAENMYPELLLFFDQQKEFEHNIENAFNLVHTVASDQSFVEALHQQIEWKTPHAVVDIKNSKGTPLLNYALQHLNYQAARELVAAGASAHIQDANGLTPLHVLAKYPTQRRIRPDILTQRVDIGRMLIAKGARASYNFDGAMSPLQTAALARYLDIHLLQLFIHYGEGDPFEEIPHPSGDVSRATNAVRYVSTLDVLQERQSSSVWSYIKPWKDFFHAVESDDVLVVRQFLLQDPRWANRKAKLQPVLHIALEHKAFNVFELLLDWGADTQATNELGETAFDYWLRYEGREDLDSSQAQDVDRMIQYFKSQSRPSDNCAHLLIVK